MNSQACRTSVRCHAIRNRLAMAADDKRTDDVDEGTEAGTGTHHQDGQRHLHISMSTRSCLPAARRTQAGKT